MRDKGGDGKVSELTRDEITAIGTGGELIEKLTNLWKICETKQLASIFKKYMESLGVQKWDARKKDNRNSYYASGKDTNWNRATCCYYKDCENFANENISITLRKRAGSYLIVAKQGTRAFEVDHNGVLHYEEDLLKEITKEHKSLFDVLLAMVDV